jgi:hypothetical protein
VKDKLREHKLHILNQAHKAMWDGKRPACAWNTRKSVGICGAINQTAKALGDYMGDRDSYSAAAMELALFVNRSLDNEIWYDTWLRRHHLDTWKRMKDADFQAGRRQWLRWMANEVKEGRL